MQFILSWLARHEPFMYVPYVHGQFPISRRNATTPVLMLAWTDQGRRVRSPKEVSLSGSLDSIHSPAANLVAHVRPVTREADCRGWQSVTTVGFPQD